MRLNRIVLLALCILLILSLFAGCGAGGSTGATGSTTRPDVKGKSLSVVVTVFPAYDWARQIIGEDNEQVALTLLLDKGSDFHSYQPTVEDIYKISTCDVFIYVGGESDKWVPDALAQASNKDMSVVCLLDALGSRAREEETLEGMEAEAEDGADGDEGPEYDEHVWLSLRNAMSLCAAIRDVLIEKDGDGEKRYQANFQAYTDKLSRLEQAYASAIAAAPRRTLLFADRYPFLYLAKDYDLTCWAAFSGCSAESEASFETVNFLVNKTNELGLDCIMVLEGGSTRLAETVIASSQAKSAQILGLDSLQSVTAKDVDAGVTYLGVMEKNLEVLKQALN